MNKHSETRTYICYVLWIKGHTETAIAKWLGLRRKQVAGIINRAPFKRRALMTDAERQQELDKLKAIQTRDDGSLRCGGRLNVFDWQIEPLMRDQRGRK